jgi:hypothetical protein
LIPCAKALALATATRSLNQGTRQDPLTIRVGNCVVRTVDRPNPARRIKKNRSGFT